MGTNSVPASNSKRLASMRLGKEVTGGALAGSCEAEEMIAANFLLFAISWNHYSQRFWMIFDMVGGELSALCLCTGSSVSEG